MSLTVFDGWAALSVRGAWLVHPVHYRWLCPLLRWRTTFLKHLAFLLSYLMDQNDLKPATAPLACKDAQDHPGSIPWLCAEASLHGNGATPGRASDKVGRAVVGISHFLSGPQFSHVHKKDLKETGISQFQSSKYSCPGTELICESLVQSFTKIFL